MLGDRALECSGVRWVELDSRKFSFHCDMMNLNAWVRGAVGCSMGSIGAKTTLDAIIVARCLGIGRFHGNSVVGRGVGLRALGVVIGVV